jgi:hypothetical protein
VALLVRGPQGVRRRVRAMQKVVDGVQTVLARCVEAEAERKAPGRHSHRGRAQWGKGV